jgi:hypothetical protein
MDADMKRMMAEMQASIQGLSTEMRASMKGLEQRFDGLEGRFDRLEKKFKGLSMEFFRLEHKMDVKFDKAVADMKGIYNQTAWAADSAKISSDKAIAHGAMLIDHEDRIRALEGKRKTPPAA